MNGFRLGSVIVLLASFSLVPWAGADEAAVSREKLTYDGKPFEWWRDHLKTELKAEKVVEGLRAMGAFGSNGYANEAVDVTLEIVRMNLADVHDTTTADQSLIRDAVHGAIQRMGPSARDSLLASVSRTNEPVRAFLYLHVFTKPIYRNDEELYYKGADDPSPKVRELSVYLMLQHRRWDRSVIETLAKDPSPSVRRATLRMIDSVVRPPLSDEERILMGPDDDELVSTLLMNLADDTDPLICAEALTSVRHVRIEPELLVPLLAKHLSSPYFAVEDSAGRRLHEVGESAADAIPDLVRAMARTDGNVDARRKRILSIFEKLGPAARDAVPALRALDVEEPKMAEKISQTIRAINRK